MGDSNKEVLLKALEAEVGAGSADLSTLFTDDVVGMVAVRERVGARRRLVASSVLTRAWRSRTSSSCLRGLDEVGNRAFAEWVIEARTTPARSCPRRGCRVLEAAGRHVSAGRRQRRRLP